MDQKTDVTNPGVTPLCVCGCSRRDVCVCYIYKGGIGCDGCDLASTLCKYDFRKGNLFVLSWAGKYLFRAANVWWRCAQYLVIASCG